MSQTYQDLIYPNSPFLPSITPEFLDQINHEEVDKKFAPLYVSQLVCEIALNQNTIQTDEHDWIKSNFQATEEDLALNLHGLCIASTLIVGSYIVDKFDFKTAIQQICQPPLDRLRLELNRYKSNHLIHIYRLYQNNRTHFMDIFDYTLKNPFSENKYFLAGIVASQSLYSSLVEKINISSP